MGLAEILQMCCASHRSGQITFRSGKSYGFVFIQHGRVLHAMCGVVEGEEAVYLMLPWPGGSFTFDEDILPHKKTVKLSWEQLLIEGARRADVGLVGDYTSSSTPVVTAEPLVTNRGGESQPKLLLTLPDRPETVTFDIVDEYTHVGRAEGNELNLPYPSISGRHCIFILSGSDVVVRDLNSSNGTLVNSHAISETILLPGDIIQVGPVTIKFEPGMKRPRLSGPIPVTRSPDSGRHQAQSLVSTIKRSTAQLKTAPGTTQPLPQRRIVDDNVYVKGESAISYHDLAEPAPPKGNPWRVMIFAIVLFLAILGVAYYYIVVRR
jgi:pSer/pThr/pTyr-binding forkhead associated (FHA) protein